MYAIRYILRSKDGLTSDVRVGERDNVFRNGIRTVCNERMQLTTALSTDTVNPPYRHYMYEGSRVYSPNHTRLTVYLEEQ